MLLVVLREHRCFLFCAVVAINEAALLAVHKSSKCSAAEAVRDRPNDTMLAASDLRDSSMGRRRHVKQGKRRKYKEKVVVMNFRSSVSINTSSGNKLPFKLSDVPFLRAGDLRHVGA